ncbi:MULTISPECIES: RDD family protein [Flavobacterium]|uniref:RDD family protein n=1 Tax=Flavobacterium jumunjinense TaxID=998845 RepID=A0ABV5GJD4_9FLAO|nr:MULTISPECIES: RDD family protein [Flavobacterium]
MKDNILGKSVVASLIDYFMIFILFLIISSVYLLFSNVLKFKIDHIEIIIIAILWFTFLVIPEFKFGKTLGKKIIGIKLISTENNKLLFRQVLIRRVFDIIDIFALGLVSIIMLSNNNQRFGDKFAKVFVVDKNFEFNAI